MALTANWFFEVTADGHTIRERGEQSPEAIDIAHLEVANGAVEAVDLLPPSAVNLFVVKPSKLDAGITFSLEDPSSGPTMFALDGPVVLIGSGAVSLLPKQPEKLWFKNGTPDPVTVEILIGRDATP